MKRLLDMDPLSGLITWHEYDEMTDTTVIHYEQDVEPTLDDNKRAYNDASGPLGDVVHAASIPPSVQMKWLIEKGVDVFNPDHKKAVARLLDDSEWRHLKRMPIVLGGY